MHLARNGLQYKRTPTKSFKINKEKRINIINGWITENHHWERIVFSIKKRFSLDGPGDWRTCGTKNEVYRNYQ